MAFKRTNFNSLIQENPTNSTTPTQHVDDVNLFASTFAIRDTLNKLKPKNEHTGIFDIPDTSKDEVWQDITKQLKQNHYYTLPTYSNYVLLKPPIKDIADVLQKYTTRTVRVGGAKYLVMHLPIDKEIKRELRNLLQSHGVIPCNQIKFYPNQAPQIIHHNHSQQLPHWKDRILMITTEIGGITSISYQQEKEPFTIIPVPFDFAQKNERSVDSFIDRTMELTKPYPYSFAFNLLLNHLIKVTSINMQSRILTVEIQAKDIRKLIPPNFNNQKLVSYSNNDVQISYYHRTFYFKFSKDYISNYIDMVRHQHIRFPLTLFNIPQIRNIKFLLLILYSTCNPNKMFNYKLSTIINLTGISKKRGAKYICRTLNSYFETLRNLNIIQKSGKLSKTTSPANNNVVFNYITPEITEEMLKHDNVIRTYVNNLSCWEL